MNFFFYIEDEYLIKTFNSCSKKLNEKAASNLMYENDLGLKRFDYGGISTMKFSHHFLYSVKYQFY